MHNDADHGQKPPQDKSGGVPAGNEQTQSDLWGDKSSLNRVSTESEWQKRMYETALSNAADFVYLFDQRGRFTYANQALLNLLGLELSQVIGRNFFDLHYPVELATRLQRQIQEVLETGQSRRDETPYTSNSETREYEYIFMPVFGNEGRVDAVAGSTREITARKRTEAALRASEQRYRALVMATSDVVYRMSADWTTLLHLNGRDFVSSAVTPRPPYAWLAKNLPVGEHERVKQATQKAIQTKEIFELEHQVLRQDGSIGWTFSRAVPILDVEGNIVEWFGTASDITRRKTVEDELRDIRSRMEAALSASAIGTWSWDVVEDRFYGDLSVAKIFSVDPAIIDGGKLAALVESIHPEDREQVAELIEKALEGQDRYEANYRIAQSDGTWKWVTARGQVERDASGKAIRFPGVVIDVTDWKRAEEKLLLVTVESERQWRLYEAILSSTPDFVYVFSLEHQILYANQSLLKMWGRSREDTIGKTFKEVGYEDWHADLHCREIDEVRSTKQSIRGEVPFNGTHGRRIYDYIFVPVFDENGEVVAVAGTTRDVTQSRQLEDALRESDRRKDEFLAMLAHELRNPLVPIRTGLDLLAMDPGEKQETVELMQEQMVHIIRLVDDLLDVSRIMQGKVELKREPVEVASICNRSVKAVRSIIDSSHHVLSVSLPDEPVWVNADPVRLVQVIGNLLHNASKYMHAGGRIALDVVRQGDYVDITVQDFGIGIDSQLLPKVFDLFTQSSRSLDRAQGGLGIGLTMVQRLVNMHDGTVSAYSDGIGKGSKFVVRLPTCDAPSVVSKATVQNQIYQNRKIVVVDDNRSASYLISKLITKLGDHQVSIAVDGESALAAIEASQPEIVFLDIGLPGMDGYAVCRAIRKFPQYQNVLMVALTGYGQEQDRLNSKEAGFDVHLVKPPSIDEIRKVLEHPKLAIVSPK